MTPRFPQFFWASPNSVRTPMDLGFRGGKFCDDVFPGWWLNQPIWKKKCQIESFPQVGVKKKIFELPPPSMLSGMSKHDFQTSFRLSFTSLDSDGAELLHGATALVAVIHQFLHLKKNAIHQIPKTQGIRPS